MSNDPGGPGQPIGSLGEEAAKLFGALSEWARDQDLPTGRPPDARTGPERAGTGERADQAGGRGGGAAAHTVAGLAEALRRLGEHVATDETPCRYCPVCQLVHAVQETSPEVRGHLGDAAASLLEAATALLVDRSAARSGSHAAARPSRQRGEAGRRAGSTTGPTGVERIDLSGDSWHEADPGPGPRD